MASTWLTSDTLVASIVPLTILLLSVRILPRTSFHDIRTILSPKPVAGPFSLSRAAQAYASYRRLALNELNNMRGAYAKMGRRDARVGATIRYPEKLDRLADVTRLNELVTSGIADLTHTEFEGELVRGVALGSGDLGRVREAMKHFVRDWSDVGKEERRKIFEPVLDVLRQVPEEERASMKVLVPGCGLGRLAWDISELGFDTTANELSFFMTLAFRFLLSPATTSTCNQHLLHPHAHWFSHQRTNDCLFRSLRFPDVVPHLSPRLHLLEGDFLALQPPSRLLGSENVPYWSKAEVEASQGYDVIVTLFFLDTSLNAFATLAQIHALLRAGGMWVNLGPLLWPGGASASVELSLDEVMQAAEQVGFVVDGVGAGVNGRRTVECEYTRDEGAMMRWLYQAEFWVARKSK